ncbi:BTB/POZ domain-containing protein KCTD21-like [Branchiostoma lanceolatum]|uniref:BTB/POZ domain-containing protein KCTD21-like n=1 Tax=Branchiostoma lanceolatum TaxID=7740 RepID=UPI00345655E0
MDNFESSLAVFPTAVAFSTSLSEKASIRRSQQRRQELDMTSEVVTVNVGGVLYTTTMATLTKYPESRLGGMFLAPQLLQKDSQGNYFIDRDGQVFRYILNFLRQGWLRLPEGFQDISILQDEISFYEINQLSEDMKTKKHKPLKVKVMQ